MATWPDTVPYIQDGSDGDQQTFNEPLEALVGRTDYLKTTLDGLTNKSNLLAYRVAVTPATEAGDLVYFDSSCACYDRAQALWSESYIENGELLAAPQAYIKGWVITKHTETTADILLNGLYADQDLVDNLLGSSAPAGLYYLSATDPGKAVSTPPPLKVPAITNLGSGSAIFKPTDVFQPNHLHRTLNLRQSWYETSDTLFTGMEKPNGAQKGYDIASDTSFQEWFAAYPGVLTVFVDGILQEPNSFVTTKDNIWYMDTYAGSSSSSSSSSTGADSTSSDSVPTHSTSSDSSVNLSTSSASISSSSSSDNEWPNSVDSIVVYSYNPFTNGEPVVRAGETDTPCELALTSENGILKVNALPWQVDTITPTGSALVSIVDKNLKVAPVVSSVTSSGGITISDVGNGKWDLTTGDSIQAVIDAEPVNLNNTVELTDDPFFYYNFPAGRVSSLIGKVAVPSLNSSNTYAASAWVYRRGVIGATAGSPISFPAIDIEMTHVESPRYVTPTTIPLVPQVTTTIAAQASSVDTTLYFGETTSANRVTVTPEGTVYVKFSLGSDAYDKYITRFGIIIYLVSGDGSVVVPCGS